MHPARLFLIVVLFLVTLNSRSQAQVRSVGPGSTVRGDELRGEGVFLQGLGWYELNDAKATAANVATAKKLYDWNEQIAQAYRREYTISVEREMSRRRLNDAAKKKFLEEREVRLRTKPTPEDLEKGDALNALLIDLSDPTIQESSWRGAKVALPEDISIKRLAFQFAPKQGAKGSQELTKGLIALGLLDLDRGWPEFIPKGMLDKERADYQSAYEQILKECLEGKLESPSVTRFDAAIKALIDRAGAVVPPERNYRNSAVATFRKLAETTNIFNSETYSYAREMIADTSQHQAHTVGELLAFMRKYRLKFAIATAAPGGSEMYARLYGLMREQGDALGVKPGAGLAGAAKDLDPTPDQFKAMQGTWYPISNVMNGQNLAGIPNENWTIEIRGQTYLAKRAGQFWSSGTWSLDATKNPMEFSWSIEKGQQAGQSKPGIIRWEGGDLIRCQGDSRPQAFESLPGSGNSLTRWSRNHP